MYKTQHEDDAVTLPLREMLLAVVKARLFVVIFAITTMSLACFGGWLNTTYKSEGYFQFNMPMPDFKRLQANIADPTRWENFSKTRSASELSGLEDVERMLADKKRMLKQVQPIYPVTKAELKELPDVANKDSTSSISGLTISYSANKPELAQRGVQLIGEFLRDTGILMTYKDSVRVRQLEFLNNKISLENAVLDVTYKLEESETKRISMQKIMHDYPEASKTESRQLVSISEGNQRYLSPVTQLIAIESQIADLKQNLPRIARDQRINGIWLSYYNKVLESLEKNTSGELFLKNLSTIRDNLNLNKDSDIDLLVYNSITIEDTTAKSRYFDKVRFIAAPELPQKPTQGLILSSLLGLIFGIIFSCALVLCHYFYLRSDPIEMIEIASPAMQALA